MSRWWTFPRLAGLIKLPNSRAPLREEEGLQKRPTADADTLDDLRLRERLRERLLERVREEPLYRLSKAEEEAWIDAVRNHRTGDGSQVQEILDYICNNNPNKFQLIRIEIAYHGSLQPSVRIIFCPYPQWKCFDEYYELSIDFSVTTDSWGYHVSPYSDFGKVDETTAALEKGRTEFLKNIEYVFEEHRQLIE